MSLTIAQIYDMIEKKEITINYSVDIIGIVANIRYKCSHMLIEICDESTDKTIICSYGTYYRKKIYDTYKNEIKQRSDVKIIGKYVGNPLGYPPVIVDFSILKIEVLE